MTLTLPPAWMRPLAWLSLPLAAAAILALSRRDVGGLGEARHDSEYAMADDDAARSEQLAGFSRRIRVKWSVIDALRLGRRTLFEAAAMFRSLDQMPPATHWEEFRRRYHGACDEERHCRQVISWMEATLPPESVETDATVVRLREELEEAIKHGPPQLPEVPLPHLRRWQTERE
jgi:hypothetical protein